MISMAKKTTMTSRANISKSQGRSEMKSAKFFKLNSSMKINKSKIARETDEAIKFANKR